MARSWSRRRHLCITRRPITRKRCFLRRGSPCGCLFSVWAFLRVPPPPLCRKECDCVSIQWFTAGPPRKIVITNGLWVKFVFLNELAPAGGRGLLVFDLYIQYSGWSGTHTPTLCLFVSIG